MKGGNGAVLVFLSKWGSTEQWRRKAQNVGPAQKTPVMLTHLQCSCVYCTVLSDEGGTSYRKLGTQKHQNCSYFLTEKTVQCCTVVPNLGDFGTGWQDWRTVMTDGTQQAQISRCPKSQLPKSQSHDCTALLPIPTPVEKGNFFCARGYNYSN